MAETGTAAEQLPRVFTGTHDNLDGADGHTAWPNDVPPGQDDTWFPLRDDPWKARRMEYIIAAFWGITAVCGIGLMIVYWTGGQAQYEGALLLLAFASLGTGLVLWARFLLPGHDITASRGGHVSDPEERAAIVESLIGRMLTRPAGAHPFPGRLAMALRRADREGAARLRPFSQPPVGAQMQPQRLDPGRRID